MTVQANRPLLAYLSALRAHLGWRALSALCLTVATALSEGATVLVLVPVLAALGLPVGDADTTSLARLGGAVFDAVGLHPTLFTGLGLYVVLAFAAASLTRSQTIYLVRLQNEFIVALRQRLSGAILRCRWPFLSAGRSSELTFALTTELDRVNVGNRQLLLLMTNSVVAIAYLALAAMISVWATLIALAAGSILFIVVRKRAAAVYQSGSRLSARLREFFADTTGHLGALKTIKSHGQEDGSASVFAARAAEVGAGWVDIVRAQANVRFWYDAALALAVAVVLGVSVRVLDMPTGALVLLVLVFLRVLPRFSAVQRGYREVVGMLPAFATVLEVQAQCDEEAEPRPSAVPELRRSLRLEDVWFSFRPGGPPAVAGLDLVVPAARTTALVGPSGAGKSTVADLLIGLLPPTRGNVLLDEEPLTGGRATAWRGRVGYVGQDAVLFSDSIRGNLLWARPGATEAELWEALRMASADEFVAALPEGLEAIVGERGIRLSGGERQRLALARALLRRPSFLVLDEATSNVDSENDRRIQQSIERLHGTMTVLVIAHRLETVRRADVVYFLENGRCIEAGTWKELVARPSGRLAALRRAGALEDLGVG